MNHDGLWALAAFLFLWGIAMGTAAIHLYFEDKR